MQSFYPSSRKRFLAASVSIAAVAALAACAEGVSTNADGNVELKVRTDVYYTGAVLPLVAGVEEGIFEDHGLDIDLNPGKGSATTIQTVANGSDHIGYADAGTLVQSVGEGMPVTMVAAMVQESPLALFAKPDSGISSFSDLEGQTAGYTAGSAAERLFPAYAKATGFDDKKVNLRNVDIPTRDSLFMDGETDFTFGLLNVSQPNIEARCDCELVVMPYAEEDVNPIGSGIVVGEKLRNEEPEVIEKFLAAMVEAVEFANKDTDKAVEAFMKAAPDTKLSPEVVAEQWKISDKLSTRETTADQGFGCSAQKDWEETIAAMEQYGDVDPGSVAIKSVADNALLPDDCTDDLSEG